MPKIILYSIFNINQYLVQFLTVLYSYLLKTPRLFPDQLHRQTKSAKKQPQDIGLYELYDFDSKISTNYSQYKK